MTDFNEAVALYLQHLTNDYSSQYGNGQKQFETEDGSKYVKVVAVGFGRSSHSFIVKEDGPKFKRGDILKAAGWNAPAKNFIRGNVLTNTFRNIRWSGC